jgi:hypothetical protein
MLQTRLIGLAMLARDVEAWTPIGRTLDRRDGSAHLWACSRGQCVRLARSGDQNPYAAVVSWGYCGFAKAWMLQRALVTAGCLNDMLTGLGMR